MLHDRTTRVLLLVLAAFALGVAGLVVFGRLAHGRSNGLLCRQYPWTPAHVLAQLHADAFTVRVAAPPPGYQIDGLVGPIKMAGGPRPDAAGFTYYSQDCKRSIAIREYGPGDAAGAGLAALGSPARVIRLDQVSWLIWHDFANVEGTYSDGVHVTAFAYRTGPSMVLALMRNLSRA